MAHVQYVVQRKRMFHYKSFHGIVKYFNNKSTYFIFCSYFDLGHRWLIVWSICFTLLRWKLCQSTVGPKCLILQILWILLYFSRLFRPTCSHSTLHLHLTQICRLVLVGLYSFHLQNSIFNWLCKCIIYSHLSNKRGGGAKVAK